MNRIRILADDLTGALDSAAAFSGHVPVFLGTPGDCDEPVAAVTTATRDVALETLPARLAPALDWLAAAHLPFKKIDSLLRGNTFAEIAYCLRAGGYQGAVFAPAFPAVGRVTIGGRQCVVPPGKTLAERQPVGAGLPADAFEVFGLRCANTPAIPEVTGDPQVWIPDVCSPDDLARVAAVAPLSGRWLWCGSGGLAHALAAVAGLAAKPGRFTAPKREAGPVLVISASHHPVTREQWEILRGAESGAVMVMRGQQAALRSTFHALGRGLEFALFDLAPARLLARDEAAALLARQLDAIARQTPRPSALVVIGGDTLLMLCAAAGATTLIARASHRPGWGYARLSGGRWDGVPCFSRSGAFGDPDDLATMVRLLTRRAANVEDQGC